MASIALMTSPAAMAQPDHQNGQSHGPQHEGRGEANRQRPQQAGARQTDQRPSKHRPVSKQRHMWQQKQAAGRAYYGGTMRGHMPNRAYADPRHYPNRSEHRGWAQDRGNTYRWSEGERMGYNDWYYAPRVSYRRHHLRRPPYGYQWRRYDDRYVLVAISTGLIISVILDAAR